MGENENKDLKVTDQILRKENEAIGIGNKELYKKVEILNKKIDDLKSVEHLDVRERDSYEVIQHKNVECSQERELEDKIRKLNQINKKNQQKIVELKEEIDDLCVEQEKLRDINKELKAKIIFLKKAKNDDLGRKIDQLEANVKVEHGRDKGKLEELNKALEDVKADVEKLKNTNRQLKKIRLSLRDEVNLIEEEKRVLKDNLRELIGKIGDSKTKQEYRQISLQIIDKVREISGNQGVKRNVIQLGEHNHTRNRHPTASNGNNNTTSLSFKRELSEPDEGQGQVKSARVSN